MRCQEDSNRIGNLECQLKEARNQLSTLQSQHKSQLLEVSMLREEEKQNNNKLHQSLVTVTKFKVPSYGRMEMLLLFCLFVLNLFTLG